MEGRGEENDGGNSPQDYNSPRGSDTESPPLVTIVQNTSSGEPKDSSPVSKWTNEITSKINIKRVSRTLSRTEEERNRENALVFISRGVAKGFCIYVVPISFLNRRITGIRRGVALALFIGITRALDRFRKWVLSINESTWEKLRVQVRPIVGDRLAQILGRKVHLPLRAISGALSAYMVVKVFDPSLLNSALAFWCLVRALRCLPLPNVPGGSTIVMCLATMQIITSWIMRTEHLPKGYSNFLHVHGQKNTPPTAEYTIIMNEFCQIVHPGRGHIEHFLRFLLKGFIMAWRLYLPLYGVMFLFSKHKNIMHLVRNVCQSSLFLATYCASCYASGCLFYNTIWKIPAFAALFNNRVGRASYMCHLWIGGLPTLIERPSRRSELAAYCATFALESIYRYFIDRGSLSYNENWLVAIICGAAAFMMHHQKQQPSFIMNWLFGLDSGN